MGTSRRATVLVVDDTMLNLEVASLLMADRYEVLAATSGAEALRALADRPEVELVLLDIVMPGMDGYELCARLKADPATARIPVIFLTSLDAAEDERRGFGAGAVDFITKPFQPETLLARVSTHLRLHAHERHLDALVRERTATLMARTHELETRTRDLELRTADLEAARLQMIHQLGRAAEYRDDATGHHVIRMAHYCRLLAEAAGPDGEWAELTFKASPLHDLGKLGVPDHILRKPARLTEAERLAMQDHCEIGAWIIGRHPSALLARARSIALHHHERWDGTGYPHRLRGTGIPLRELDRRRAAGGLRWRRAWEQIAGTSARRRGRRRRRRGRGKGCRPCP